MVWKSLKEKIGVKKSTKEKPEKVEYIKNVNSFKTEEVLNGVMELKEKLLKHCGPHGKYAVLNNPFNPMTEPVFTKDGYNIFRNMIIEDPVVKMIHKMVLYIGKKISIHIGDGTTTGMLLTLNLIELWLRKKYEKSLYIDGIQFGSAEDQAECINLVMDLELDTVTDTCTFAELKEFSEYLISKVEECIEENKITIDKLVSMIEKSELPDMCENTSIQDFRNRFIKKVAYAQAYTSSHGDVEIAKIVSDMFEKLPEETLTSLRFIQSGHETKERLSLLEEPLQYSCRSDILSAGMLNAEKKSKFYAEGATVAVFNQTLVSEAPTTEELINQLKKHYVEGKPFVILTTGACGVTRNRFHSTLLELRNTHKDIEPPPIAVLFVPITEPILNDIFIISLISGIYNPSDTFADYIHNVTIEFEKGELRLSNLYEGCSELHPNLRPMYKDMMYGTYNETLEDIDKRIEKYKALGSSKNSVMNNDLNEMIRLKNNLLLNKRVSIVIGGNSYDNAALFDIVEDCINAVRKSITKGFVPGGLISIYNTFNYLAATLFQDEDDDFELITILNWYHLAVKDTIFKLFDEDVTDLINDGNYSYDIITKSWTDISSVYTWVAEEDDLKDFHAIIQPADTDLTMFKRIEEVMLKIIYTDNFFRINEGM